MIRFGLLGCGAIARRHAEILSSGDVPGATLAAVCDADVNRAREFGSKYKASPFSDLAEMAAKAQLDAITVLTPSGLHAEHASQASQHVRAVVVEKPMALTLRDADRMIEACDRNGARLFVVKQNRFNRPIVALRHALEQGRFGKLVLGTVRVRWCRPQTYYDSASWRGTWEHDGGVLANQASHHIDLLEWMMGEVESVSAMSTKALAKIEAEDTAVATLRFSNGALGVIEATTATRPRDLEGSISILGEYGSVVVGGFAANELKTWNFAKPEPEDDRVFEKSGVNPPHFAGYGHSAYYQHVVECLAHNKRQLVDGLEGRKSLELITAIYEAIETGEEVKLRFNPKSCRLGRRS
ncbi:MAG TPA: Gfo/Idh/MocA family oxidoreductase [Opitutaceae bacterium]|nr:Gfo/Idh/MocA family oxidoreductase [Opitutaceae bacterium]